MSNNKLYVGGLPYSVSDTALGDLFAEHGAVQSARVITDRMTGRSRGFGFVEMSTQEEAESAISRLDGSQMEGRSLTVNQAKERSSSGGGGGGSSYRDNDRGGSSRW